MVNLAKGKAGNKGWVLGEKHPLSSGLWRHVLTGSVAGWQPRAGHREETLTAISIQRDIFVLNIKSQGSASLRTF